MWSSTQQVKQRAAVVLVAFVVSHLVLHFVDHDDGQVTRRPSETPVEASRGRKVLGDASDRRGAAHDDRFLVHRFYKSEGFAPEPLMRGDADVTLATHVTVDRLHRVVEVTEAWQGWVSVSVLAGGSDVARADDAIDGLRMCWGEVRRRVHFHLVTPSRSHHSMAPADMSDLGQLTYFSCRDVAHYLKRKMAPSSPSSVAYPHNLMRNVARASVLTPYVFDIDAEMTPAAGLGAAFSELIASRRRDGRLSNEKEAFVLPVFEVWPGLDKIDSSNLYDEFQRGNVRPVLYETCPSCHSALDYDKWMEIYNRQRKLEQKENKQHDTYEVKAAKGWQPFYILPRNSTTFDESIHTYGFDRWAHVCALRERGYKFSVMTSSYLHVRGMRERRKAPPEQMRRVRNEQRFADSFYSMLRLRGYSKRVTEMC